MPFGIHIPNPIDVAKDAVEAAKNVVEKTVEAGVKVVLAPAEAAVNLAQGKSVSATAKEFATTIKDAATAQAEAANTPNFFAINLARDVAGETGAKIAIAAVGGQVIQNELPVILANYLNKPDLKPEDALTYAADVLLAALLQSAADQLRGAAKPIPDIVRLVLNKYFPAGTIDNAKYTVGKVGITLPEAINGIQTFMGNKSHAVTVPGIIVFSQEPDGSKQTLLWWAHELQHIVQYNEWNVAGFASRYIKDANGVEAEADAKANSVDLSQLG